MHHHDGTAHEFVTPTPAHTLTFANESANANGSAKSSSSLLDDLSSIMTEQAPNPTHRFDLQMTPNAQSSSIPTSYTLTASITTVQPPRPRDDECTGTTRATTIVTPQDTIEDSLPLLHLLDAQVKKGMHPVLQQRSAHRHRRPPARDRRRPRGVRGRA